MEYGIRENEYPPGSPLWLVLLRRQRLALALLVK